MAPDFGALVQDYAPDATVNGHEDAAEAVDLNDPRLQSEVIEEDAAADAYAVRPPLPDGKWRAKLAQAGEWDVNGDKLHYTAAMAHWTKPPRPYLATNVEAEVLDQTGKWDGTKLTDYHVKTLIGDRDHISALTTVVNKSGGQMPSGPDATRMQYALAHLAKNPEVIIETAWHADCEACQKAAKAKGEKSVKSFLVGMHRFPQRGGKPDPEVQCPTCKAMTRGRARIIRYWKLSEAKPTFS